MQPVSTESCSNLHSLSISLTPLRRANAEVVLHALEPRERLTPKTIEGIGWVCGLSPEAVETALDDLAQMERVLIEVIGASRFVRRVSEEVVAA